MIYITQEEYAVFFPGTAVQPEEFTPLAEIASSVIEVITMHRVLTQEQMDALPEFVRQRIKKATAMEIDLMIAQGGFSVAQGWGMDASLGSETIGKYHYSLAEAYAGSSDRLRTINGVPIAPLVFATLFPTGLLNRAVGVVCI